MRKQKYRERIELQPYDWPETVCECFGCEHRALWRIKFYFNDADLARDMVGADKETLLTCSQCAYIFASNFQEVGDLVVCFGKKLLSDEADDLRDESSPAPIRR